jgi:glycosyltransferase involved in cell wall biosynthesis
MFGNRIINGSKFIKFNNGIDVEKYRYNSDMRRIKRLEFDIDGKYVLGNVGRLSYQKNQAYLLDIFESIRYKNSNTVLFIVGEGELENELKEKAKLKKIENYVYFLGSRDDINDLMQIFDVFVFPSHFEGLGIALVEAQASGLKCFASTNVPKESNILGNIEYLDCNLSPDIWADKINTYLLSKIEFDRESAADCVIKNGYDIKSNIRVIENFYMKCLVDVGVSKD